MAKAFYSLEEACQKLGRTPDQLRELVREGLLREFRDSGKVVFRAEDIDRLSGGAAAAPELEPVDEELPSVSEGSGGTSVIGLAPLEEDLGGGKEDTVVTGAGLDVVGEDEVELDADPMAKTHVTTGAIDDQVSLEGAGSGSGLLDLTREADDTSLGAELLDEIYPGEEEAARTPRAAPAAAGPAVEEEEELPAAAPAEPAAIPAAAAAVAGDPFEGVFAGMLVAGLVLMILAGSVAAGVLEGFLPRYAQLLTNYFYFYLGGAALLVLVSAGLGWLVGRARG